MFNGKNPANLDWTVLFQNGAFFTELGNNLVSLSHQRQLRLGDK